MLIDDLDANQNNLTMRQNYYQWVHRGAQQALDGLARPTTLGRPFLIDAYTASQILP